MCVDPISDDDWLHAALDCLGLLPDQAVVELSRALPNYFPQDADGPQYMEPGSASPLEEKGPFYCWATSHPSSNS